MKTSANASNASEGATSIAIESRPHPLLLALSMLVDSSLEPDAKTVHPALSGCLILPEPRVILALRLGRTSSPTWAETIAHSLGCDVIATRLDDDPFRGGASFAITLVGDAVVFKDMRLFLPRPSGPATFLSAAGPGAFVGLSADGLWTTDRPPYDSEFERRRGLLHGNTYIRFALQGWF